MPEAFAPRLAVLKALGDNTRYAIYLELARSPRPLSTAEVAETLGLHPNTVRPHLERMREVGLLDVEIEARGTVGRPHHRYSLAADAPSLGLEPATFPLLARMLLQLAARAGLGAEEAIDAGRHQGEADATRAARSAGCLRALVDRLDELGFDPAVVTEEDLATVAFAHCPFADLAEEDPDVVCGLHHGLVEGFVEAYGPDAPTGPTGAVTRVAAFHTLLDRTPCRVDLEVRSA
ncbi:MAG TPA: helix-turn-helix domain-containing protein [Acidimicrobiales bacterium]